MPGCGFQRQIAVEDTQIFQPRHTGRQVLLSNDLSGIGVPRHHGAKDGQQNDGRNTEQGKHRTLVAHKADAGIPPETLRLKIHVRLDMGQAAQLEIVVAPFKIFYGFRFPLGCQRGGCRFGRPFLLLIHGCPPLPNGCADR